MEQPEKPSSFWAGWILLGMLVLYLMIYIFTFLEDLYELNLF
jgi:hypothetical protein